MISREDAKSKVIGKSYCSETFDDMLREDDAFKIIDAIYDSIGSCGECEHYSNKHCTNENSIAYHSENAAYEDDGCLKDFKRKQNV